MSNTYTNLLFHIVYSTKYRKPLIKAAWQDDLYAYMGGIIRDSHGSLLAAGGMADHVHLLAKLPPTIAISDMLGPAPKREPVSAGRAVPGDGG